MKYCNGFPILLSSHVPTTRKNKNKKQKQKNKNNQNMKMERPPRNYINDSSSNFPFSPSRLANKPWLQGSL